MEPQIAALHGSAVSWTWIESNERKTIEATPPGWDRSVVLEAELM